MAPCDAEVCRPSLESREGSFPQCKRREREREGAKAPVLMNASPLKYEANLREVISDGVPAGAHQPRDTVESSTESVLPCYRSCTSVFADSVLGLALESALSFGPSTPTRRRHNVSFLRVIHSRTATPRVCAAAITSPQISLSTPGYLYVDTLVHVCSLITQVYAEALLVRAVHIASRLVRTSKTE